MKNWIYKGHNFLDSKDYRGFIYKITFNLPNHKYNGFYYIGYKLFNSNRTIKKSKKELKQMVDKRGSKVKKVTKESNWKSYIGSCVNKEYKELWNEFPNNFSREILYLVNKEDWSEKYYELKFMILYDWESKSCWNGNFNGKYFKCN